MTENPALGRQLPSLGGAQPAGERTAGAPQLILLLAGSCMAVLAAVLIAPVLPQMAEHFAGVPGVEVLVPIVVTAPALVIALTAPFAGFIADKIDRRRVLLFAMVAYAIVGTAPLYLDSLGAIVASRVLLGLGESAIITCCTTMIGDYWQGARRAKYLGLQTLVATLAAAVILTLGGLLGAAGWRTPFWLYLTPLLLVIPMAKLLWRPAGHPAGEALHHHLEPLPWRRLLTPCLVTLFGGIVFYALVVQLPYVLAGIGIESSATIGAIAAIMSLATAAGAASFTRLSRYTPRVLLPIAFGLSAVGLAIVSFADAVPLVTVGAVITGGGTGLLLPTMLTWAVNRLHFEQRGRGTGLWTGSLWFGQFASPIILAAIGVGIGGLQPALGVLAIASLAIGVVILATLRRNNEPLQNTNG